MKEKCRCKWCNLKNPIYVRYHDEEWGVPQHDDKILFELFLLEPFQAGLSWETILNKRENFREAFDGFDPEVISRYDAKKISALMENPGIIRNRRKIEASITNAALFLKIQEEWYSFDAYIWHFTSGNVMAETGLTCSPLSDAVSDDLRKKGMKFIGTTVVYSYLQAIGVISSHDEACFLHRS